MIDLSKYRSQEELFDHLHSNKSLLIAQKKSVIKQADPISYTSASFFNIKDSSEKKLSEGELLLLDKISIKPVINTTNFFDSHKDVHIDGIWNKNLKEQKQFFLTKEHKLDFDNTLSDEVKAYVRTMTWNQLGYNWNGKTQALIFESILHKEDNTKMFEKYIKGKVPNHSVGMQYVKLFLAINSDSSEYKEEKEVWDKYYPIIVNNKEADNSGYFWAVTEAKAIEGAAVMRGSNYVTPNLSVNEIKNEPSYDTHDGNVEPVPPLEKSMFEKLSKLN